MPTFDFTRAAILRPPDARVAGSAWQVSLPLITAAFAYLLTLYQGGVLGLALLDGDTYWHIATGHWIMQNRVVPVADPFSHTMLGAPWIAHEWLSEVVLALAHDFGGWTGVVALTGVAFAAAIAILTRALLHDIPARRVVLLVALAVMMANSHALARPHMLAMPILVLWTAVLVRAVDTGSAPPLWLLPAMTLWANLHGGFTLGLALAAVLATDAVVKAWRGGSRAQVARMWGLFLVGALIAALLTPHGYKGLLFTWQIAVESGYAIARIDEWASPNFHQFQPLMVWLLLAFLVLLLQGLTLPPIRAMLIVALIYLSLKHVRHIALLGLLSPLLFAASFGRQWRATEPAPDQLERAMNSLARKAGPLARMGEVLMLVGITAAMSGFRPAQPPDKAAPVAAIAAARAFGVQGNVLNEYSWGGYLIYSGMPVFIDGRADMYGETLLRPFAEALDQRPPGSLEALLRKHQITWTLLSPETPAIAVLDRLPDWRRIHADKNAVVHVRVER